MTTIDGLTIEQRQGHRDKARSRLERVLRNNDYSVDVLSQLHAGEWDLYVEGAPYLGPGEVVCRGVGVFVALEAEQRAAGVTSQAAFLPSTGRTRPHVAEIHVWKTPPEGPYTGHATLHCLVDGRWHYIESGLRKRDEFHRGIARTVPLHNGELTPVPLTKSGEVDVDWMRGIRLGARNVTEYVGQATTWQLARWRREMLHQLDLIGDQLEDGSAFRLVGFGEGKRRSLA